MRTDDLLVEQVTSASMACWADVDLDGFLDVFIAGYGDDHNRLFRNRGGWAFESAPLPAPGVGTGRARACVWADLDGDRLPDLVIANAREANVLLRNRGSMSLEPDTASPIARDGHYGYGLSASDADGDGRLDVFLANFDEDNALYLGSSGGGLVPRPLGNELQSPASKGHVWGDFDLDGEEDLYLGSGTPRPGMVNMLWLGSPGGSFRLETSGDFAQHADTSAAVAGADFDLDGDLDLFVANWGSPGAVDRLYVNQTSGRRWLSVGLEGVRSNRMGVGAQVSALTVDVDGRARWRHRWLNLSTGYAGQNEPVVHFGLGSAAAVDSLVVRWPSGAVDRVGRIRADRRLTVREGEGVG